MNVVQFWYHSQVNVRKTVIIIWYQSSHASARPSVEECATAFRFTAAAGLR